MKASAGKRVLMLLENTTYPNDVRVRKEATSLVRAGLAVSLIVPAGPGQPRRETIDGVHVYRFRAPAAGRGFLGYSWEFGYCLAATWLLSLVVFWRRGFDVIHAHNPPDLFVLIAAFYKLFGKRFVFDHHDLAPEMYQTHFDGGSKWVYRVLLWFEKLSCRLADHVIATNESYKAVQMARGKTAPERITVVRNGPDLNRVQRVDPDPVLRQKAGTIIGYVGTMGALDGIDYLLRSLRHLIDDLGRTDFYCVLIGRGDARESAMKLAAELGLDDRVSFPGWLTEMELMRPLTTADICVDPDPSNPYTDRSTMIKMMEYMALGKPIVAFDLPEHRVTAQSAALYARPNDELDFARQIAALMDDLALRERLGRLGQQRVATELAWSHQEPHLLEAYRKLGLLPKCDVASRDATKASPATRERQTVTS